MRIDYIPTLEQIEIGLKDKEQQVRSIYELRKDELLAKMEENQLINSLKE